MELWLFSSCSLFYPPLPWSTTLACLSLQLAVCCDCCNLHLNAGAEFMMNTSLLGLGGLSGSNGFLDDKWLVSILMCGVAYFIYLHSIQAVCNMSVVFRYYVSSIFFPVSVVVRGATIHHISRISWNGSPRYVSWYEKNRSRYVSWPYIILYYT